MKILELIDRYRIAIGIFLILVILVGGGILLFQGEKGKGNEGNQEFVSPKEDLAKLEKENEELKKKLAKIEEEISRAKQKKGSEQEKGKVSGLATLKESLETKEIPSLFASPIRSQTEEKININTADAKVLESLPGIGPVKAQAIVDWRNQNGPFKTIEEIIKVPGIGEKTFQKLKDKIVVE